MKEALGAPASSDVDKLRAVIDEQQKKLKEKEEHIAALQKMVCHIISYSIRPSLCRAVFL